MTHTPSPLDTVTLDQLQAVTGAGIGSQIGNMFGAEGAKWGGVADSILGMFGVGGAGGGASPAPAASAPPAAPQINNVMSIGNLGG
jgi:hypothetical protein